LIKNFMHVGNKIVKYIKMLLKYIQKMDMWLLVQVMMIRIWKKLRNYI